MAVPLQASGSKRAPLGAAVFAAAEGRGGVNVHTSLGTSAEKRVKAFSGSTMRFLDERRRRLKVKMLIGLVDSLGRLGHTQEAVALMACGRYFNAGDFRNNPDFCLYDQLKRKPKLISLHCDSVFCPECAARRAKPYQQKIWEVIRKDKRNLFFVTFTLKSTAHLDRERVDLLIGAFKKLRESKPWDEMIAGGFYSIEATWNQQAGWHPHLHVLVKAADDFGKMKRAEQRIWLSRIKALWREITGDSYYIHIDRVYGIDKKGRKTRRINERAVKELVKYSTKAADFCERPDLIGEFRDAFKNVRRMQAFGCFYGAQKQVDKETEKSEAQQLALMPGCICGKCSWGHLNLFARVHVSDTVLLSDGSRELSREYLARSDLMTDSIFDSGKSFAPAEDAALQVSMFDNAA